MTARDRLAVEQDFHDFQCGQRAAAFPFDDALRFTDDSYLDHESWIRPAMARLGPLDGRRVLDYGCGHGMAAVVMARAGARVTAFDLSSGYADEARHRARATASGSIWPPPTPNVCRSRTAPLIASGATPFCIISTYAKPPANYAAF